MADNKKPTIIPVDSTTIQVDDLKWMLPETNISNCLEGRAFYLSLDSGIEMNVEAGYSTIGSNPITGTHITVQYRTKIYFQDGKTINKTVTFGSDSFKLSDDNLDLNGGTMNVKFHPSTMGFSVAFKPEESIVLNFDINPESEYFKLNDGTLFFNGENDPRKGHITSQYLPRGRVTGKMTIDGTDHDMAGLCVFRRFVQHQPMSIGKWNMIHFHSKDASMIQYEFEMPTGSKLLVNKVCIGAVVKDKKLISVSTDNRVIYTSTVKDEESGYPKPTSIQLNHAGSKIGSDLISSLKAPFCSINLLAELPAAVRVVVQTFVTSPYKFCFKENDVRLNLKVGEDSVEEIIGSLYLEIAYLSKKFK
ncbi:putative cell survival pathways protein [Phlyctochytrium planicorne]|nr:putative cell survival pathways protein [Phlyctochytrium planicorne]